ncbi:MAG: hypothetical protein LIO40_06125 [Ruminococcus sp.]|nr:hypothetical protein [Ruminococcus sp.]
MFEAKITIESPELADAINKLAAAISGAPIPTPTPLPAPAPEPQAAPKPTSAVTPAQPPRYTYDQIMTAGAALMDAGKVDELINLLRSFGVQAVMDLKQEQLGEFATAMRELGAKI